MIKCENWKWPETQVLLSPAWPWLSNSTISKFCHFSYMASSSPNFKNLANFSPRNFLGLVIHLIFLFFLDIGRNYISPNIFITITIVSNITVLVSQNIIFFGFFTAMSQEDFSKCLPQPHSPLPYFHQDCLLFDKKYLINFLLLWSCYLQKIMHFRRTRSFLCAHYCLVLILLFCLYVFCGAFLLFCHYVMANDKLLLFFRFPKKLSLCHNFKLLISFRECKEIVI